MPSCALRATSRGAGPRRAATASSAPPGRSPRARRSAAGRPSVSARPSKLSRRRSQSRRVALASVERSREVLGQEPGERRAGRGPRGRSSASRPRAARRRERRVRRRAWRARLTPEKSVAMILGPRRRRARRGQPPAGPAFPTRRSSPPGSDCGRAAPRRRGDPRSAPGRPSEGQNTGEASTNDRGREPHQEVRPHDGGGRGLVPRREGRDPRLPRAPTGPARRPPCASSPATCPRPRARRGWPATTSSRSRWRSRSGSATCPRRRRSTPTWRSRDYLDFCAQDQGRRAPGSARPGSATRSRSAGSATCATKLIAQALQGLPPARGPRPGHPAQPRRADPRRAHRRPRPQADHRDPRADPGPRRRATPSSSPPTSCPRSR